MDRIRIIHYKNKKIFYTDYRGLVEDEEIETFINEIIQYQLKLNLATLQLTNVEGVFFTPRIMKSIEKAAPILKDFIIKDAIVGITGIKRILFQFYNTIIGGNARAFQTEEEAMEWLIQPVKEKKRKT
jgi:hypothetical protein